MGLIRSGAVIFISTLLFLSVFIGNLFLTLSWSLEYDNVQPIVADFANNVIENHGIEEALNQSYDMMIIYCQDFDPYNFSKDGIDVDIPCSEIAKGPENVIEYGVSSLVDDFYYKEYNCSFFDCIKKDNQPYVLVSEKARDYFRSKFNITLLISIIVFVLLFLLVESKSAAFIISGVLISFSALPFRKFDWILSFLPKGDVSDFFLSFFTKSYNVFLIMLIIGISFFIIGIALHFLGWGIKLSEFFRRHTKDKANKDDVSKNKKGDMPLSETTEEKPEGFEKREIRKLKEEVLKLKEETLKLKEEALNKVRGKKSAEKH